MFSWMGIIFLLQEYLLPIWTPPRRASLAAAIALPPAVVWAVFRFYSRVFGISIDDSTIKFHRGIPLSDIPLKELLLTAGIGGLDVSGGELITWKRLVLFTPTRTVTLKFDPAYNSRIYEELISRADKSSGVPFPLTRIDRACYLPQCIPRVSSQYLRSAAWKFLVGVALLASCAALITVLVIHGVPESAYQGACPFCVVVIGGIYLLLSSIHDFSVPWKLRRMLHNN